MNVRLQANLKISGKSVVFLTTVFCISILLGGCLAPSVGSGMTRSDDCSLNPTYSLIRSEFNKANGTNERSTRIDLFDRRLWYCVYEDANSCETTQIENTYTTLEFSSLNNFLRDSELFVYSSHISQDLIGNTVRSGPQVIKTIRSRQQSVRGVERAVLLIEYAEECSSRDTSCSTTTPLSDYFRDDTEPYSAFRYSKCLDEFDEDLRTLLLEEMKN